MKFSDCVRAGVKSEREGEREREVVYAGVCVCMCVRVACKVTHNFARVN